MLTTMETSRNGSAFKSPPSDASSPSVQSPDIKPVATPPSDNGIPAVSPVLGALSTTSISASTAPSTANDWPRGGSPGNLISLMGESPPTQPSSYEDPSRLHQGWAGQRQFMSPQPASPSPPNSMRRPLSFQMEPHYQVPEVHNQPSTAHYRRSSMHSQFSHVRMGSHPPLPHQAQAHFYGAPDIDFEITSRSGMKAGDRGYYFGFDLYPSQHADAGPGSDNVAVAGYEGGLEVYSVSKRGLDRVASLKGLRGGVYNAKILPWSTVTDSEGFGPLVAVVIHGPVLPPMSPEGVIEAINDASSTGRSSHPSSPRPDGGLRDGTQGKRTPTIEFYQTTVEVYSLRTSKLVSVLLQAPQVPLNLPISSPIFRAPPPSGAFAIRADAGTIVVSSGATGECWVYRQFQNQHDGGLRFGCAGKLWTSIQQRPRADVAEEADKTRNATTPARQNAPPSPILALNGRWIAYCPPAPSSQMALRAHVPVPLLGKAPAVTTMTPPQLPSVTSTVDLPNNESMVNKVMREATQELISGAKWVGQQSLQAWNSYWNKSSTAQPPQARSPPLQAQPWGASYPPRHEAPQFPPTHGTPGLAVTRDPGLVSIVDVETLGASSTLHPLTTFIVPLGCSFLSFSPPGLSLFTASSKGDVQAVWDLMRIQYTKSSPLQVSGGTNNAGPRVRQVAHFSRMTVARIVDVAWARPNGERIAMVTERGTVHLLDMPSAAFTWPPPRPRRATEATTVASEASSSAVSLASSALGAALEVARPLINRPRRSSANVPGAAGTGIMDSASHGGRVIASTISNSLGKTGNAINQLRHTGENRVTLPSNILPSGSCVAWIAGRRFHTLYVLGDGLVRTFPSKTRRSSTRTDKARTPRGSRYKDFKVPGLPEHAIAPTVRQFVDSDEYLDLSDREMDAGNTMTLDSRPRIVQLDLSAEASIPQAEIESSAPYQPFHTDRRVAMYEYGIRPVAPQLPMVSVLLADTTLDDVHPRKGKKKQQQQQQQLSQQPAFVESTATQPWAFGQPVHAVKLDLGLPITAEEDFNPSDDHRALPPSAMERVLHVGENDEQIVVTTRRRRGARHADQDEDGFFEDDCEVLDFADQRV
jgi:hypothetical protein